MSRILLDDQIVGECNEFLHKLQVDRGPERVKMFDLRHVHNIFSFKDSNGKCWQAGFPIFKGDREN